ncbi:ABC transporter substrate-binding protein [Thermococcus sp. JdF3]|uniref:ABC transporter substrate-binding protein n=1 Tax=Thermococcus sp. JdF3 TaxID=1638258 RepID=UPI00143C92B9|nr:helical backbone metal receptor [Thermococcus sp. JdF3]NJE01059.1 ABC transporter substrate-binding protein [Thermococcus sp. JdF3]
MKKTAVLLMALLIGAVVASGCLGGGTTETGTTTVPETSSSSGTVQTTTNSQTPTETTQTETPHYPITVVDFANRTLTIEKPPERVVTLAPSITEDLYYLGLFDRVVGVTDFDDFPPGVANVTRVGGYGQYANLEVIASLNPDLILVDSYSMTILEDLQKIAPVLVVDPHSIDDIPRALDLLGAVFNAEEGARKATAEFEAKINTISSTVKDEPRVSVFYVVWNSPLMTAGGGTFISDVIELAGGENIFNDTTGWPTVSPEQVIERNPDVVLLTPHCGMSVQDVYSGPLASIKAAQDGKVYVIENENDLIHPSPRVVLGLEAVARLLHPDAFKVGYPLTVTDFAGRTVTIDDEPERIVTLAPSITESLFYIGAGDKVIGVTDYDDFPPAVKNITRIGGYGKYANLEAIAALEPDLILVDGFSMDIMESLERIAPVVVVDPRNITAIYNALELLGKITNREEGARAAVADMQATVGYVTSTVAGQSKPRTFFLLSYYNGYWTAGAGTFVNDLITLAGGENIFNDVNGWGAASEEQIIARNPEVIIISPNAGIKPDDLCSGPLAEVDAVKNGRVYVLSDENLVVRPGPRIVHGLEEIAGYLHPDVFNLQPQPLACNATVETGG